MKNNILKYLLTLFFTVILSIPIQGQDPEQSIMNINNITEWISPDGFHDWIVNNSYNGSIPKGKNVGAIFTDGILWGGKVYDGNDTIVRVKGSNYSTGNLALNRIFRVRTDYNNADLADDAANFFQVPIGQVTHSMVQDIYNQYEKDWLEWPADKGAPFLDVNNNGKYEPAIDIPGVPSAAQTIWINYSDGNSRINYGSPPIGLDIQETYWAYNYSGALSNVIYRKVDIIYKGTASTPSNARIDSMHILLYSDPDLGNSSDDFDGCDTSLNLGYCYNSTNSDFVYDKINLPPPAVGYSFIQGVSKQTNNLLDSAIFNFKWIKGKKYFHNKVLGICIYDAAGNSWTFPSNGYIGALEFYNYMRGYKPDPYYPSADAFPSGVADVTPDGTYTLTGDPVTGTGKIDGNTRIGGDSPGDRQLYLGTGSFNMTLNDTAEIVLVLAAGFGTDNLNSITKLRYNVKAAIYAYNNLVNDITSGQISVPNITRPITNQSPNEYTLFQNYPNPFNSTTVIKYELPDEAHVQLIVYDILGRIVKTLVDEEKTEGRYEVKFNADNLASGIYFYKISFTNSKSKLVYDNLTRVNKLILIK